MQITKELVQRLIKIVGDQLQSGAGDMSGPGHFCIQQAVSQAIGKPNLSDQPRLCVAQSIVDFGILLNDASWESVKSRADGLRRLAVAELGSEFVDADAFGTELLKKWNIKYPSRKRFNIGEIPASCSDDIMLKAAAEMAVEVLIQLGTEGSKYLYLTDPKTSQTHKDFMHRTYCVPQLQWRGYGC